MICTRKNLNKKKTKNIALNRRSTDQSSLLIKVHFFEVRLVYIGQKMSRFSPNNMELCSYLYIFDRLPSPSSSKLFVSKAGE